MNALAFNDRTMIPYKIFLNNGQWIMEGKLEDKKVLINLSEIVLFENSLLVDEVVIVRPLTNKIVVDPKTNDVLKIFVDSVDKITSIAHENRFAQRLELELPPMDIINDAVITRKSKMRRQRDYA